MHTMSSGTVSMYTKRLITVAATFLLSISTVPQSSAEPPFEMTTGGMQYKTLLEGDGTPATVGQIVHIHFVAWIDESGQKGRELFNSRRNKGLVSYVLGTDTILPALNEGVVGMKPGGRRLLMAPPVFAYGKRGVDDVVPPNSSLILLVDLVATEPD